jgi:site-specific DNA-methyltransferase (adenine-specific)
MKQIVINGDNIELLKNYPDNYFDAVVTDPPYGLGKEPNAEELMKDWIEKGYHEISGTGFMGKEWDAFIPQPIFWKEVYRVLKHGGHILSFFGTRTYDWGVMSMRFAGFEVRDCIQWLYGSGFPKSHNISKALDKQGGESLDWFIEYILEFAKDKGISKKELTMLFPSKNGNPTGWLWNKQNNQSITLEQYNKIKYYLNLPFENIEEAKREVIGKGKAGLTKGDISNFRGETEFDITAPSTDAAKLWEGWGTALKPANEPIVLARKPLEKGLSIAENILKWGVGGINIDASRVGLSKGDDARLGGMGSWKTDKAAENVYEGGYEGKDIESSPLGRFPANIILTHHEDCECKGTKKVKSDGHHSWKIPDDGGLLKLGLKQKEDEGNKYAENGQEEVEDWDCHEDCPIRILDEQSGISKSSASIRNNKIRNDKNIYGGGKGIPQVSLESNHNDKGGASRFFYCAKASKSERNKGLSQEFGDRKTPMSGRGQGGLKCKICNKWKNSGSPCVCKNPDFEEVKFESKPNFNGHPTVKPIKLMQYLVKMITPRNGIVLDPFCGSGTTGVACKIEGFEFVGLEQDIEYTKIAQARIENYTENIDNESKQAKLF